MKKRFVLIILILHSILLVGVPSGHGYGILLVVEFLSVRSLISSGIDFTAVSVYTYEDNLMLIGICSLLAKVILLITFFFKNRSLKKQIFYVGLTLLVISLIGVVYETLVYSTFLFAVTSISAIPLLVYFGRVVYLISTQVKDKKKLNNE